jgi:hypothetical protein
MPYSLFVKTIQQHQTDDIKVFLGRKASALERVPLSFIKLLGHVLPLMQANINQLRPNLHDLIVIFGLQPAAVMISTMTTGNEAKQNTHFCCTLDYMCCPHDQSTELTRLSSLQYKTHTLMIDFTTGEIMDEDRYLAKICSENETNGYSYGYIPEDFSRAAWQQVEWPVDEVVNNESAKIVYYNPFMIKDKTENNAAIEIPSYPSRHHFFSDPLTSTIFPLSNSNEVNNASLEHIFSYS